MRKAGQFCVVSFSFCAVLLSASGEVRAQGSEGISQNPLGPFATSVERRRAEQELRALPLRLSERRERNLSDPRIRERMNEDFIRVQAIRMEMVKAFGAGKLIDAAALKSLSAEVRRRSSRLRSMLALSDERKNAESGNPEVKDLNTLEALNDQAFRLCIEISRFTENPLFKSNGSLTAQHAAEANKTLGLIVSLAESIQKAAAKLR